MVVWNAESPRSVSSSDGGPVTESQNSADVLTANRFHHCVRCHFGGFEMHGDSAISPGIFQLMAAVRHVDQLNTQFARGLFETARLVAELSGEEQQSIGSGGHARWISRASLNKAIRTDGNRLCLRLWTTNGDQLIGRRLGTAIPRLAEKWNTDGRN
jgi:hypothetical protein